MTACCTTCWGTIPRFAQDYSLGSTALTAYDDGVRGAELRYRAWGETRYAWEGTPTTYRFTGQREDATIGLYFYNARYYDASLSRFIQADTIVPNPADPQAFNRYSYVLNNPLVYTDPSGHWYYDPGFDALVQTDADYNEWPGNFNTNSPLYALQQIRRADDPACPYCSTAMLDYGQWYAAHPSYDPQYDFFLNTLQGGGQAVGIGAADVADATRHYSLYRTAQQLAAGEGWKDLAIGAVLENGPPLIAAVSMASSKLGSEGQLAMTCPGCGTANPRLLRSRGSIASYQHIENLATVGEDGVSAWCENCGMQPSRYWTRSVSEIRALAAKIGLSPDMAAVYTPQFGGKGHWSLFIDAIGPNGYLLPEYAGQIDAFLRSGAKR